MQKECSRVLQALLKKGKMKKKNIFAQFCYITTEITFIRLFATLNGNKHYYIVITLNLLIQMQTVSIGTIFQLANAHDCNRMIQ